MEIKNPNGKPEEQDEESQSCSAAEPTCNRISASPSKHSNCPVSHHRLPQEVRLGHKIT